MTLKSTVGTELNIVQDGLPDVIPLEACYLGWQESLRNLAKLVEPEINQARQRLDVASGRAAKDPYVGGQLQAALAFACT